MDLISMFVFLFGLVVGSFLNAVIYRLESGESVARGRSYCPHCKHTLAWYDLVPLASFAMLEGKCRYCNQSISWQYPLVELATALIFLSIFSAKGGSAPGGNFQTLYLFTVASLLIILFVYDLRHYILPDKILFSAIGIVFAYRVFEVLSFAVPSEALAKEGDLIENLAALANPVLAGVLASAFFLAIFLLSRGRAMGFGDVKLALFMGLFLGWPNILVALFLAFFSGATIGLVLIILKKKGLKSEIPFGPFLITGTLVALLWRERLVDWYMGLLLV